MTAYFCSHHETREETKGEIAYKFCGCDGTVHLGCRPRLAPEGTSRPREWPHYLTWKTEAKKE